MNSLRCLLHALGLAVLLSELLGGCGSLPQRGAGVEAGGVVAPQAGLVLRDSAQAHEAVMLSLALLDTGYRFGGTNPEAGLDCSGMVAYVYGRAAGLKLPHNAAQIAAQTRPVSKSNLRPGDLVFFNTLNRPYSHVGIYVGDGRFIHAPSSKGKVHLASLENGWFASRFDGARSLYPD